MRAWRTAFTLVELLAVICVIAILIALIVPGIGRAIESAQATKCVGNLRAIGAGLLTFASDHDGTFPIAGGDIPHGRLDGSTHQPGWTEQLEPYLGTSLAIYRCVSCGKLHPENQIYSYFMGAHAAFEANKGFAALRLNRIDKPSHYILGGDISLGAQFTSDDADKDDYTQDAAFGGDVSKLHRGMANILFADGGVRPFKAYDRNQMEISYTNPSEAY